LPDVGGRGSPGGGAPSAGAAWPAIAAVAGTCGSEAGSYLRLIDFMYHSTAWPAIAAAAGTCDSARAYATHERAQFVDADTLARVGMRREMLMCAAVPRRARI